MPAAFGSVTRFPEGSTTWAWRLLNGGRIENVEKSASMQCIPRSFQPITFHPVLTGVAASTSAAAADAATIAARTPWVLMIASLFVSARC